MFHWRTPSEGSANGPRSRLTPLRWLLHLDAAYRQYRALKNADAERLADMGISRKAADRAFYRQFADKKID